MRRILLVMDDCGAGDALRLTYGVRAVRRAYPEARITMVASQEAAGVYSGTPMLDRLITSRLYQRRGPGWRRRLVKMLELCRLSMKVGVRNDLVIVFWWGSSLLALLALVAGRKARIGYTPKGRNPYTSNLGPFDFDGDEVEQNRRLLVAAGITETPAPIPSLAVSGEADAAADRILRQSGWDGRAPVVVMHTGSDWACQQWLPERWSQLADAVAAASAAHVVFTGSRNESEYIEVIRGGMGQTSASIAGATSIPELAAILRRAQLVVTVDSAAYVVARSQGVPTVVLAGPSHPERIGSAAAAVIVKRMTDQMAREIADCKRPRYLAGGCLDYSCPLAGLRELSVADVLSAVSSTLAVAPARAAV
jgi:ADP-heptose:LPS heptosyltransferase